MKNTMSYRPALRLPVISNGAEYLVMGNLMRRNILTYKAPEGNEGYDLICIHPEPRYKPKAREKSQVRIQVKSRYATDCDRGFPIKKKQLDTFDFLVVCFLNIGKFYGKNNGLTGEDSCKIMRYAGISDKLTATGVFEYNQSLDENNQTAKLVAQMIWYFLEGYKARKKELNPNVKDCVKYTVAFDDGKNEIVFYKSNNSGRWWMGVPFKREKKQSLQKYFVACSYQDYEKANHGEIPERWIKTLRKLD